MMEERRKEPVELVEQFLFERRKVLTELVERFLFEHQVADAAKFLGYTEHERHHRATADNIEFEIAAKGFSDSEFKDMLLELEPYEEDAE